MSSNKEKFVLFKMDEDSGDLLELFLESDVQKVEEDSTSETFDFIVLDDFYDEYEKIQEMFEANEGGKEIALCSEPGSLFDFIKSNGRILFSKEMLGNKIFRRLFKRKIRGQSSFGIEELFGKSFENYRTCKVTNFLKSGYYIDIISAYAHENSFDSVNTRSFLFNVVNFFSYLAQSGKASYPCELDYGYDQDDFFIQFSFPVEKLSLNPLLDGFLEPSLKRPAQGLLEQAFKSAHLLDISSFSKEGILLISASWNKVAPDSPCFLMSEMSLSEDLGAQVQNEILEVQLELRTRSENELQAISEKTLPGESLDYGSFMKVSGEVNVDDLFQRILESLKAETDLIIKDFDRETIKAALNLVKGKREELNDDLVALISSEEKEECLKISKSFALPLVKLFQVSDPQVVASALTKVKGFLNKAEDSELETILFEDKIMSAIFNTDIVYILNLIRQEGEFKQEIEGCLKSGDDLIKSVALNLEKLPAEDQEKAREVVDKVLRNEDLMNLVRQSQTQEFESKEDAVLDQLKKAEAETERFKALLADTEMELESFKKLNQGEEEDLTRKVINLEKQLELKDQIIKNTSENLKNEKERARDETSKLRQRLHEFQRNPPGENSQAVKGKILKLEQKVKQYEESLIDKEKEIMKLDDKNSATPEDYDRLMKEHEQTLASLIDEQKKSASLVKELEELKRLAAKTELSSAKPATSASADDLKKKDEEIERTQRKVKELEHKLKIAQQLADSSASEAKAASKGKNMDAKSKHRIKQLEKQAETSASESKKAQKSLTESKKQIADQKKDLQAMKHKNEGLEREVAKLKRKLKENGVAA